MPKRKRNSRREVRQARRKRRRLHKQRVHPLRIARTLKFLKKAGIIAERVIESSELVEVALAGEVVAGITTAIAAPEAIVAAVAIEAAFWVGDMSLKRIQLTNAMNRGEWAMARIRADELIEDIVNLPGNTRIEQRWRAHLKHRLYTEIDDHKKLWNEHVRMQIDPPQVPHVDLPTPSRDPAKKRPRDTDFDINEEPDEPQVFPPPSQPIPDPRHIPHVYFGATNDVMHTTGHQDWQTEIQPEYKYTDFTTSGTILTTGVIEDALATIPRGFGHQERINERVVLHKLHIRGVITAVSSEKRHQVTLVLYLDRNTPRASPVATDLLESADPHAFLRRDLSYRFRGVKRISLDLAPGTDESQTTFLVDEHIDLSQHEIHFADTSDTPGAFYSSKFGVLLISTGGDALVPAYTLNFRFHYDDF